MPLNPFSVRHLRPEVELTYCECADIIATKVAENCVARRKLPCLYWKTDTLNSDMTSDFHWKYSNMVDGLA